ncbi:family 16 glycosylhydrolase [Alteraurantiacibacter aquimixticola]|uniref:Beta-glucanase n=1 Tax=Alteraurantiacibacter aquimixticola TaxID=2489173 RepID=A0A4V4U9K2_9SPHN|nr:family 16 glycosylhydrolase [Alteraurantiacibacter aquimixticola]TIX51237.1 glycosyl hydrolase family protein [Alteraurantiacibacter aquimixticola]
MPARVLLPVLGLAGIAGISLADRSGDAAQGERPLPVLLTGEAPFVERFETIDRSFWSVSDGWYNGDYMVNDWRAMQVWTEDGLHIALAPNSTEFADYSSGEIQSGGTYGHGYYEARLRAAPGSGIITGFFTYIGPHWNKPWNEIDVEILGKSPRTMQATYFTGGEKVATTIPLSFDATEGFHTYGFDWQRGSIRWFVDGSLVHEEEGDELPLPNERQKVMFSLWGTRTLSEWAGRFDETAVPTEAVITCVAYSASMNAGGHCSE